MNSPEGATARFDRRRIVAGLVWLCVGAWSVFALIRLFGLERGFPLVPLVAFTPWIAGAAVIPIGLAAALRQWRAVGVAALAAAALAVLIIPRAFGGPTSADGRPGPTVGVLAANVSFGQASAEELVGLAEEMDAEALVVSELTPGFAAKLEEAGVGRILAHSVLAPETHAKGTGIYSSVEISASAADELPGGFALPRVTVEPAGAEPIELIGVHAVPPTSPADWTDDLEAMPPPSATPTVLAGDFNATLDHAEFRDVLEQGYLDAAETLGEGLTATWPMHRRLPPIVAIDHVLADQRIGIRGFSAHELTGTDHRAVFAELELPARTG